MKINSPKFRLKNLLIFKIFVVCIDLFIPIVILKIKEHFFNKKLGIETDVEPHFLIDNRLLSLYKDKRAYAPTSYGRLEKMVDYLKLKTEDVFIDLGSGKGRVVCFVAMQRLKRVIGIELDKGLVAIAENNIKNLKINITPIEIFNLDAVDFDMASGTVFFMHNPFGYQTLTKILRNIKNGLVANHRKICILYYIPMYRDLLDNQDWLTYEGEISESNIFVWRNSIG